MKDTRSVLVKVGQWMPVVGLLSALSVASCSSSGGDGDTTTPGAAGGQSATGGQGATTNTTTTATNTVSPLCDLIPSLVSMSFSMSDDGPKIYADFATCTANVQISRVTLDGNAVTVQDQGICSCGAGYTSLSCYTMNGGHCPTNAAGNSFLAWFPSIEEPAAQWGKLELEFNIGGSPVSGFLAAQGAGMASAFRVDCGPSTGRFATYSCEMPCVPSCTGRSCGSDGCDGTCGSCEALYNCIDHQCVKGGGSTSCSGCLSGCAGMASCCTGCGCMCADACGGCF